MKTYARIENGIVAEILSTDGDIATMFHASLTWVLANAGTVPGFTYIDGAFAPPVVALPALADLKAAKLDELAADFAQRMGAVKAGYPDDEIQSWFDQKSEAVAYTASASAPTPLLSAMASARGITVSDLAARVIANAIGYATAAGLFIGKRQKYEDAVNAAADPAAVTAVTWID